MAAKEDPSLNPSPTALSDTAPNDKTTVGLELPEETSDPVYQAKAHVLNDAIQSIGMGRYQWHLFFLIGFGWASDNLWPIVTSLILTPVTNEFSVSRPPLLSLAQNIGLLVGAVFWGFGCDIFGRRFVRFQYVLFSNFSDPCVFELPAG